MVTGLAGYAMLVINAKFAFCSALSYFWPDKFSRNWNVVIVLAVAELVLGLVTAVWSAIMAGKVREEARYCLQLIKCHEQLAKADGK